ncbi:MT-A70 domain containing protein [Naviculisporaceae sp. PSN 640]
MDKTASSVIYQIESKSVILLDLPRSIEEAQVLPGESLSHARGTSGTPAKPRYLISSTPLNSAFSTPEPQNASSPWGTGSQSAGPNMSTQIAEMMTLAAVEDALEVLKSSYGGPWHLPRHTRRQQNPNQKERKGEVDEKEATPDNDELDKKGENLDGEPDLTQYLIPPDSHHILGTIESQRQTFLSTAPKFNLIIMDPPWPNRSAKRKRGDTMYQPVSDFSSIRTLLSLIPVASHLLPGGLVAVWVTNSSRAIELLTSRGGIFDEWQVDLVGEWTWLKVTATGEPIVDLHSSWRKPWERLLIARRRGGGLSHDSSSTRPIPNKVIVAVPDVHSRKPNLRGLFQELLPESYQALEVFARSLTAGWWSWGDQALLYQHRDNWVEADDDVVNVGGC